MTLKRRLLWVGGPHQARVHGAWASDIKIVDMIRREGPGEDLDLLWLGPGGARAARQGMKGY